MKLFSTIGIAVSALAMVAFTGTAEAQSGPEHPASKYYHGKRYKPQVRGYAQRRGGYTFTVQDTINTYGDSRSRYGATRTYRDPMSDRQSSFGPFDHGFFFDSGTGLTPYGGYSPYMH